MIHAGSTIGVARRYLEQAVSMTAFLAAFELFPIYSQGFPGS